MPGKTISPDTDRRFVQAVLARGVADPRLVARLAEEHSRGDQRLSLAQTLCERGVIDRRVAAGILQELRAERAAPGAAPRVAPTGDARRIGGYEITGELGRGGMGVVFRAFDTRIRRPVALKMILDPARADPEDLARFEREARAAGKVDHPGIVKVFDAGVHEGKPFIVMELVEGESFEALLKGPTPLSPRRVAEIVRGVAEALEHAHRQGIVHRDVKPQNILLDREGLPRLADFGLARDTEATAQITISGSILGTPAYLAPEQARGAAREQGPATDVYALGAVLYRALVGRPPFEATNVNALLMKVVLEEPVPLRRLRPKLHVDLETIALRCLAKAPSHRYTSARAVAEDLQRYLDGEAIEGRPVGRLERLARRARRNPLAAASLLLALVAVVAVPSVAISTSARASRRTIERVWLDAVASVDSERLQVEHDSEAMRPRQGDDILLERRTELAYRVLTVASQYAFLVDTAPAFPSGEETRLGPRKERMVEVALEAARIARFDDNFPLAARLLAVALQLRPDDRAIAGELREIAEVASTTVHERFQAAMTEAQSCWFGNRDAEGARRQLSRARALNPLAAAPWSLLPVVSEETGDIERALSEIEEGTARAGERPVLLTRRAMIQQKRGQHEAALRDFDRAIELAPSVGGPYICRMAMLSDAKRDAEVLREIDRLERSPHTQRFLEDRENRGVVRRLQGLSEGRLDQLPDAERHLTEAIELLADPRDVYVWRSLVRMRLGYREGQIADLRHYIAHPAPKMPQLLPQAKAMLEEAEQER